MPLFSNAGEARFGEGILTLALGSCLSYTSPPYFLPIFSMSKKMITLLALPLLLAACKASVSDSGSVSSSASSEVSSEAVEASSEGTDAKVEVDAGVGKEAESSFAN